MSLNLSTIRELFTGFCEVAGSFLLIVALILGIGFLISKGGPDHITRQCIAQSTPGAWRDVADAAAFRFGVDTCGDRLQEWEYYGKGNCVVEKKDGTFERGREYKLNIYCKEKKK